MGEDIFPFQSYQLLVCLGLRPLKGCLSWPVFLLGPSTSPHALLPDFKICKDVVGVLHKARRSQDPVEKQPMQTLTVANALFYT